jgi:peptidoglycan/xylan/chitin deacetylase (PgdA/CDA1 family)
VLLHDGSHRGMGAERTRTVAATEGLIPRLRDQGYEFVTVEEMHAISDQL